MELLPRYQSLNLSDKTAWKLFYIPARRIQHSPITAAEVVELDHRAVISCTIRQVRSCLGNPFPNGHNCRTLRVAVPRKHLAHLHPFHRFDQCISSLKAKPGIPEPCWKDNNESLIPISCLITPRQNKNCGAFHAKRTTTGHKFRSDTTIWPSNATSWPNFYPTNVDFFCCINTKGVLPLWKRSVSFTRELLSTKQP